MAFQFASRFALIIFAVVSLRGAMELASFPDTVTSALVYSLISFVIGYWIGEVCRRLVEEANEHELLKTFQKKVDEAQTVEAT